MICKNCSKEIPDNANFCNGCGAKVEAPANEPLNAPVNVPATVVQDTESDFQKEQSCLNLLVRMTKYQRVAYKISAIVLTVLAAIYISAYLCMGFAFAFSNDDGAVAISIVYLVAALIIAAAMVPVVVVNWIMAKKTASYYKNAYQDCTLVVKHLGSVGSIVIAGIFNSIALIFEIIGFVNTKTQKNTIERIKKNQGVL